MRSTLSLTWTLMRGQRLRYGMAILSLVIASSFLYLVPLVPQVVLDGVLADDPADVSGPAAGVLALLGGADALSRNLWWAGAAVVGLTLLAGVFTYFRERWSAEAAEAIARKLRDRLYDQLQHLPVTFHDDQETGDLVQRCTSDVETFRLFLANQVVEIGRASIMMILPIPLMLMLDVRMTLVSLVTVPPIVVGSYLFFVRVRRRFRDADEAEGRLTSRLQENLTGIRVVRAFARQDFEKSRFAEVNAEYRDLDRRLYDLMAIYWSGSDLVCMGQKALVVAVGGWWLAQGELPVGTFYFFLAAVNLFIWPIRMMGRILTDLGKATVAIGRIGEIVLHPRESAPEVPVEAFPEKAGEVIFDQVSFAHGDVDVLEDVSFEVRPGETLALLGPSGAGKSTIVNLLLRLYDPDSGTIRCHGQDLTDIDRKRARHDLAVVLQEPFLYSKTVKENIRLGRRTAHDDEIHEAASIACVHRTILDFDDGYDTVVGERGVTLSGGQRQRVALARALLERPKILILDDALSAVDTDTERMILEALSARRGKQTTIVIAHRLSTLRHADQILVLDGGRVVQRGTHDALLAEEGLYRRLWTIQTELQTELDDELSAAPGATGT